MKTKISLHDKYALDKTRAYMTGIDALVRLPMLQQQRDQERGLNTAGFISGYRGSPLGTLDQALWKAQSYLDKHHIKFQPGVNEDLAATAVWGSQQVNLFEGSNYDGVFGMWYGKGPGVDRSMDVIKHANAFGTSKFGGVLAIAGDDHASKSSTLPHQSEHMFIGASIPILSPSNVQEVLDLGIYGWELSRYCGSWVALKAITENMDSAISAEIDPNRVNIILPENFELPEDGVHGRLVDTPLAQEARLNKFKIYAAREFARVNNLNKIIIDSQKPRLGIITTGKAYLDVMQALEDLGIDEQKACDIGLRIFKIGMIWPLEPTAVHDFAQGLDEILVVEEKRSIIEDQLTGQLYNWEVAKRPRVIGEFDEKGNDLLPNLSELTPAMVARAIASRIRHFYKDETIEKRLAFYDTKEMSLAQSRLKLDRIPHYCSGCPHSSSTRVPAGSRAMGGIGCHYMGTWEKGDRKAHTFTQMGGEGVTWVGQAPFTQTKHVFQNLGDGTYFHSGLLAIRQAVAANVNITYKILYNDAVAMTGGQPVDGPLSVEQIIYQLRGEGIIRIAVVSDLPNKFKNNLPKFDGLTLNHRDDLMVVQNELKEIKGTSVLIYEQTCAAEKRRRRKKGLLEDPQRRVVINPSVCEGCGDCSTQSNCLSILPLETELGRKRQIDQSACNKDFSCLKGFCPSLVTVVGGQLKKSTLAENINDFPELPTPSIASIEQQPWNIVVTGIGGTGVLTVTALVAMAAHIEGKGCATMNQTGLAQKFGAVVSHVRVGKNQKSINAVRIPAGDADLLLGCDLVVSAGDEAMAKVNVERSHAIINDYESTTAEFIDKPNMQFPANSMKDIIKEEVGSEKVDFVNATGIANQLFGDSIASNLFLLGFACQKGKLPVSAHALEQAIGLNNVAIEFNKKAFLWGRRAAFNLQKVKEIAKVDVPFKALEKLEDIINDRYQRLTDYQNKAYADSYLSWLTKIRECESSVSADSECLSISAAKNLYTLMAYKDEYEVARLYSNGEFATLVSSMFEGDYRIEFNLSPALFSKKDKTTGLPLKRQFSQKMKLAFKLLEKLKGLRGTAFDIFSYTQERKNEKNLIGEYQGFLTEIFEHLKLDNIETALALLNSPLDIKGYGHIKEKNMEKTAESKKHLLSKLRGQKITVINLADTDQVVKQVNPLNLVNAQTGENK